MVAKVKLSKADVKSLVGVKIIYLKRPVITALLGKLYTKSGKKRKNKRTGVY